MVTRFILAMLASLTLMTNIAPVLAQEAAADYHLPPETLLGEGWVEVGEVGISPDVSPAFRDVAGRVYGGPAGGRVVVFVLLAAAGMTADETTWQAANLVFDAFQSGIVATDGAVERDLATPALTGCTELRRARGTERDGDQVYSRALTLCAVAPDVFVLVAASGADDVSVLDYVADTVTVIVAAGAGLRD